jgi:hypothetical protein
VIPGEIKGHRFLADGPKYKRSKKLDNMIIPDVARFRDKSFRAVMVL